jgi:hypothetical protein
MQVIYEILCITGWTWAAVFGAYLAFRLRSQRRRTRRSGFEVITRHEEQS